MENNFPKYVLAFLALIYMVACVAEIFMVKGGTEAVFESVKTVAPHITMLTLGFYFSKK